MEIFIIRALAQVDCYFRFIVPDLVKKKQLISSILWTKGKHLLSSAIRAMKLTGPAGNCPFISLLSLKRKVRLMRSVCVPPNNFFLTNW
jgi:hypothetical protein